jgi:glycosyltransferase involved in cell wall biosynthesis
VVDAPTTTSTLVSAVIIFLNGERFIAEAIESVLAQTYGNWELLLVDDGSTDGATRIAKDYAARFPDKVHYLEHDGHANRGMSASRNLGIRHARGELIALLDADDVWLPDKLADQVPMLIARRDAAMLYGRTHIWFGWTGRPIDAAKDYTTDFGPLTGRLVPGRELLATFLRTELNLPCTCSVLLRRDAVERAGYFEESFRAAYEDMAFYAKLFRSADVFVADGCWDRYRQHARSSCQAAMRDGEHAYGRPSRDRERYLRWLEQYLTQHGESDRKVWGALRRELWPYDHPLAHRWYRRARALGRPLKQAYRTLNVGAR